jgi:2-desacetyl-2-hydroxyethyl bacteriochlorophyllide A dehydrogenase
MKTQALWFEGPEKIELREESIAPPKAGQVVIQAEYSAISAGSEMLFYRNLLPNDMAADLSIPSLIGKLSYPLKYGYSLTGRIIQVGSKKEEHLLGKRVFTFHPHQSLVLTATEAVMLVPDHLANKDALFLPNTESAVSFVMDGRPVVGERVLVFGQGVVGLLTTGILSRFPLSQLISVDPVKSRRDFSMDLGATSVFDPLLKNFQEIVLRHLSAHSDDQNPETGADLIFELSGNPKALQQAINLAAYGGRIVVGSWYGNQDVSLQLGDRFHRQHLQLISSQVSTIHLRFSGQWNKQRRYEVAWEMITALQPSKLITHEIPFPEASRAYQLLADQNDHVVQIILTY